jgi:hypothetical protein
MGQFDNITSMYAEASLGDEHRLKTFDWSSDYTYKVTSEIRPSLDTDCNKVIMSRQKFIDFEKIANSCHGCCVSTKPIC